MSTIRSNRRYRTLLLEQGNITLQYDFETDKSLEARVGPTLGITRATEGRYYDGAGVLQTAAAGAARFDHNPATGESLGLLVEGARTNVCLQSEDLSTTWTNTRSVDTQAQGTAPDGTNTANKITDNSATGENTSFVSQAFSLAVATTATASVYLKADQLTWAQIRVDSIAAQDISVFYDLTNGVIGATVGADVVDSGIQDVGNGWFRCWVTFTTDAADGAGSFRIFSADDNADATVALDGTSSILMWGGQLEVGAFPTSYIPTTTVSVARNGDVVTTSDVSWMNTTEGTIYIEASEPILSAITGNILVLSDSTDANRIIFQREAGQGARNYVITASSAVASPVTASIWGTADDVVKHAFAYKANDFLHQVDGGSASADTTGALPSGIDALHLGANQDAADPFFGTIRQVRCYDEKLGAQMIENLSNGAMPGM